MVRNSKDNMNNPQAATQTKELTVPALTSKQKLILFLQADVWWEKLQDEGCSDENLERELLEEYGGGRTNGKTYLRMVPWLQFFDTPDPNKKAVLFEKTECLNAIREVLQIPREGETNEMVAKTDETRGTAPRLRKQNKGEAPIQPELIEDARQSKKLPAALKKLLAPCAEAIYEAATWKGTENDYKSQIQELMSAEGLTSVELPNGGRLIYKPGKPSLSYVKPKSAADASQEE
jgi:hypothetical protein